MSVVELYAYYRAHNFYYVNNVRGMLLKNTNKHVQYLYCTLYLYSSQVFESSI